ncbi:MAG: hypothetical protein PHR35_23305 [Kiritimatiellae bacterium]|nr:hypothetical protein [Kiritimatiellia bacterium]
MTKRETTSLLVKLMGIYSLVQFVPSLSYVLHFLTTIRDSQQIWMKLATVGIMIISPAIWIGFCILIIRKSDSIAKRVYREDSDASQLSGLGFQEMQVLGYNFIGLLLLVQSFPQIVSLVTTIKNQQMYAQEYWTTDTFCMLTLPQLLSFLTQLILGLILFLKPKGLANLWRRTQGMKYERIRSDNNGVDSDEE